MALAVTLGALALVSATSSFAGVVDVGQPRAIGPLPTGEFAAPVSAASQEFGSAVAVAWSPEAFGPAAAYVAAPLGAHGGVKSGYVMSYAVDSGVPNAGTVVAPPYPQADGFFGSDVAAAVSEGGLAGAPSYLLAVGSSGHDVGVRVNQGIVYVFGEDQGQSILLPIDGTGGEFFGASVDMSGDGSVIVVGAPLDSTPLTGESGAAHVFERNALGTWVPRLQLIPSFALPGDRIGRDVAVSPDGATIVIGAPGADIGDSASAGLVSVFTRGGQGWQESRILGLANPSDLRSFGEAVDIDGDTIVVGAPFETVGGRAQSGRAYAYRGAPTWPLDEVLQSPAPAVGQEFGAAVQVAGRTALVGAPGSTAGGRVGAGVAYDFTRGDDAWSLDATLRRPVNASPTELGRALALAPDGQLAVVGSPGQTVDGKAFSGGGAAFAAPPPAMAVAPGITGTPRSGGSLTARVGSWQGTVESYWAACDAPGEAAAPPLADCGIVANGPAFDLPDELEWTYMRLVVGASTSAGTSFYATATVEVGPRAPGAPVSVTPPASAGQGVVGSRLRAKAGTWRGSGLSYAYSWWRCPTAFAARITPAPTCERVAQGRRYALTAADAGAFITVQVTARNASGVLTQVARTRAVRGA